MTKGLVDSQSFPLIIILTCHFQLFILQIQNSIFLRRVIIHLMFTLKLCRFADALLKLIAHVKGF